MQLFNLVKLGLTLLAILTVLDVAYLAVFGKYFNKSIMKLQGTKLQLKYIPAILCYLLLIFVLHHFIISKNGKPLEAFILGASIYGVYELTNYATLNNWPLEMVLLDTTWGGILFALTTLFYYKISKK